MAKKKGASGKQSAAAGRSAKVPERKLRRAERVRGKSHESKPATAPSSHVSPEKEPNGDFPIVGIGASAGGLEACSQLLSGLPDKPGMALVVVQHLAPKHHSILPDLLQSSSHMPVMQATDGIEVRVDHVYVIPPNVQLHIAEGKLWLMPRPDDRSQYMPIDYFFRTLAEYAQNKAIGIILSGTASDGAVGLREIKGVGGITMVQEPHSAKYDGMPRAAIAMGFVDLVITAKDMAAELVHIGQHPLVRHLMPRRLGEQMGILEDDFNRIFLLLRSATGVDFSHYKLPTIKRRLQRRMVLHKMTGIEAYLRFLHQTPQEIQSLYQDILIHVTRFFREPESFKALAQKCFPQVLENRSNDTPIRIWVPGCSTGEDAYSVAIALLEFLSEQAGRVPIQVFGTDISDTAVEQARAGSYSASIAADVSADRLRRFFTKSDTGYKISKVVRDLCVFARQDLTRDPPFSKLDLIVCRNVMIYLTTALQRTLLSVFHYALKPSGFLMVGSAETTGPNAELFSLLEKRHKLYIKKQVPPRAIMEFGPPEFHKGAGDPKPRVSVDPSSDIQSEASRVIIAKYAPPGVIVDADLQIVQFRGHTGAFLEPAPGDANLNVLKMAREGLLYGLRAALYEARKTERPSRKEGLRVKSNGRSISSNLEVVPLFGGSRRYFLVLFEKATEEPVPVPVREQSKTSKASDRKERRAIQRVEQELVASREYLQSIIQELQSANEELQSANEEILSSNEELQSTNEELNTVNEELHGRNDELSRLNSDLINLLSSVQIAIVMVSSDLRIRRFTPMAEKALNLIPTDVGRPISDIKPKINCPDLERMIVEAVDTMRLQEKDVQDAEGNLYSLRIRPYKSIENRIDGAVLSLFQIERPQGLAGRLERYLHLAEGMMDTVRAPLALLDSDLVVSVANRSFVEFFGVSPAEVETRPIQELGLDPAAVEELRKGLDDGSSGSSGVGDLEVKSSRGERTLLVNAQRIPWGEKDFRILMSVEDLTPPAGKG